MFTPMQAETLLASTRVALERARLEMILKDLDAMHSRLVFDRFVCDDPGELEHLQGKIQRNNANRLAVRSALVSLPAAVVESKVHRVRKLARVLLSPVAASAAVKGA